MLMEMLLFTITLSTRVITYRFVLHIQVVNDTEYFLEKKTIWFYLNFKETPEAICLMEITFTK